MSSEEVNNLTRRGPSEILYSVFKNAQHSEICVTQMLHVFLHGRWVFELYEAFVFTIKTIYKFFRGDNSATVLEDTILGKS